MRQPMIAGNWKMYKTIAEARQLVIELGAGLTGIQKVEKVLCPPFTALMAVRALLEGTDLGLGAQNMHWESEGAYTGEVSPTMVAELCQYVILGHSERRTYFGETDVTVNLRTRAALAHGIKPIVCIGETLTEYEAGETGSVVERQVRLGLRDLELASDFPLVIAYEPVWAIGTGRAATADGANTVIADFIRPAIARLYGDAAAQAIRVLYGGSVKANNAAEFFHKPEIDGALVGGASLQASDFIAIVQAAAG